MATIKRFEDMEIWKIAKQIGVQAYLISDTEPIRSDFGLKDQLRRAAMSMSDNIAEGFEYNNNPDFIRFLIYAKGSSGEFRSKILILREAKKIDEKNYEMFYNLCSEFSSKTKRLIEYLKKNEKHKKQERRSM